jgi:uncharacterized protein DUF4166/saccharopine dehydrogenase-like protein
MQVLILGGYGTFGGRLARLLADEAQLTLIIAGRSAAKATAFAAALAASARIVPLAFDRDGDVEPQLRAAAPDIVVDASGPFQAYGADPYRVVEACIALGLDYLDLADGSDFVAGIARFDAAARERGVFALSGASTCPVLTAAAVRRLARPGDVLETIAAGIAPSPYAGLGLNVVRAIASYAGKRVALRRDGRAAFGHALIDSTCFTIAPPGALPLDRIRFALVDVPDLCVLPALWPSLESVWFGAGAVPAMLHRGLSALAWLVRLRLLPSLTPLAKLFHFAMNRLRWGEHRGGMFVSVSGRDSGGAGFARSWHMVAEGDDGPFIPSMAAAAILRHLIAGKRPRSGARAAVYELELGDYEAQFASRRIASDVRGDTAALKSALLFQRILGSAFDRLPEAVRTLHSRVPQRWEGMAAVERGSSIVVRLLAALFGFPRAAEAVPIAVDIGQHDGTEHWRRSFGGRDFSSHLSAGRGRYERLIVERFGPFAFGIALVLDGSTLRYVVRRWSVCGVPLPSAWAPGGVTREFDDAGRFGFDVEIRHRIIGLIVRYKGWLAPAATPGGATP